MKVSERWLRTFVNPPVMIAELAEQLTQASIEVDSLEITNQDTPQGIFTFKIPPNRGDCLSIEGIAREVSVLNNLSYQSVSPAIVMPVLTETFSVEIEEPALCPRYFSCIVRGINSAIPASDEIKERLMLAGLRSVSRVVDILNYVMLELGQPLHAFDLTTLKPRLCIRRAKAGEKIVLLVDEKEILLTPDCLVIADNTGPQALAGIMGGLASSVTDKTAAVLLESAYFHPVGVRLTAQRHSLKTDGSYRFERGTDPSLPKRALERVLQLLSEDTSVQIGPIAGCEAPAHLPERPTILLRHSRILRVLGVSFSSKEINDILRRLNMEIQETLEGFTVVPPSYRQDITIEEDLIEEIGRVIGLHHLVSAPLTGAIPYPAITSINLKNRIKTSLVDRGYSEAVTYSFIDPLFAETFKFPTHSAVLKNPISREMAVMRSSLWPGLLQAVQYNQRRQQLNLRLFEMGTCFPESASDKTIQENLYLSGVIVGALQGEQWGVSNNPHDFYDLKKDVEALFAILKEPTLKFKRAEHPALHPGQSAEIFRQGKPIGWIGSLHPELCKIFELEGPVSLFELNMEGVLNEPTARFKAISKFPSIRRDIAVVLDQNIEAAALKKAMIETAGEWLESIVFFDVYQGKGVPTGQKSLAIGLVLRHPTRTLVENEISDIIKEVVLTLANQFRATLRE
jgi:phenylalanyl-tRNA synthetase beta chain